MIAGHGRSPASFAHPQSLQITCSIDDILFWLHHLGGRAEICPVIMIIDLHAAEVDEFLALLLGFAKLFQGIGLRIGDDSPAFNIECIGVKAAFNPCFSEAYRIEYTEWNVLRLRNGRKIAFADFGISWIGREDPLRGKSRQRDPQRKSDHQRQPLALCGAFQKLHCAHEHRTGLHLGLHSIQSQACFQECHAGHCRC